MTLTARQRTVLIFATSYAKRTGQPATLREIAEHFGFTRQRAHQIVREIKRRGRRCPVRPDVPPVDPTKRQQEILDFVIACVEQSGYPPTCREIADHFGVSSTHTIQDHLEALERKGRIANRQGYARAIRVLGVRWRMERIETT